MIIISDSSCKKPGLMQADKQRQSSIPQAYEKSYSFSQWILIVVRLALITIILCFVNFFHEWIRPRIIIPFIRRYLSCIVNLFWIRVVLLLLGFFKFQCENYRYFDKMSRTMTFKSGWVGIASQKTIVEFLYYSYLFNPTYVKIIEYHEQAKNGTDGTTVKLFYTPLTFRQAFFASLKFRGFDPIVIKGEAQLKKFKRRKMLMPTLISECFQELNGPILIFLPCTQPKQQIKAHKCLGQDIYDNQKRFLRSGVAFMSQIEQFDSFRSQNRNVAEFATKFNPKTLEYLTEICSQLKINILTITATQIIKYKYEYNRDTYSQFIDELYTKTGTTIMNMGFEQYLSLGPGAEQEAKQQEVQNQPEIKQENQGQMKKLIEMQDTEQNIKISMIDKHQELEDQSVINSKFD